jgi:chemotaxis-related protein WspD
MENHLNTLSILGDAEANIPTLDDCWNHIGVMGDRSCDELKTLIHCRNCAVYSAAGRSLLERIAPPEYLEEWTDVLAETSTQQVGIGEGTLIRANDTISVIIFRLGNEKLALPVGILQEVTPPCIIHTVPHRSDDLFLGILNIRGETLLCSSLSHLLNLESLEDTAPANPTSTKRMIVAGRNQNKWVFPVDEVHGIYRFQLNEFKDAPVVISKASEAYTKGVVNWQDKKVNFLNYELLFSTLNRKIF